MTLRLPFVSRRAYVEQRRAAKLAEKRHAEVLALLTAAERRNEHLLDTIVAMKMGGATLVRELLQDTSSTPSTRFAQRTPSRIQQAIDENPRASNSPQLRNYLMRWADKELRRLRTEEKKSLEDALDDVVMQLKTWHIADMAEDEDSGEEEGYLEFSGADADDDAELEADAEPAAATEAAE
jgi:hypothetical protein